MHGIHHAHTNPKPGIYQAYTRHITSIYQVYTRNTPGIHQAYVYTTDINQICIKPYLAYTRKTWHTHKIFIRNIIYQTYSRHT